MDDDVSEGYVSVHSIVTDNEDFLSGDEAPEDMVGQKERIIKNHVVKVIQRPGHGFDKPSRDDFIEFTFKCYFEGDSDLLYQSKGDTVREFIKRISYIPESLKKAIYSMRREECSKITIQPKYAYKKVSRKEKEFTQLKQSLICGGNDLLLGSILNEESIEKFRYKPIVYEFFLKDFRAYFDLTGENQMMKFIVQKGEGVCKPSSTDTVSFEVTIYIDSLSLGQMVFTKIRLSEFPEEERTIIKSMKKNEESNTEISPRLATRLFFLNEGKTESILLRAIQNALKGLDSRADLSIPLRPDYFLDKRIFYVLTLTDFLEIDEEVTLAGKKLVKNTLLKGIGKICPWSDYICSVLIRISNESHEPLFCNYDEGLFTEGLISTLQENVIKVKNYDKEIQFIAEKVFNDFMADLEESLRGTVHRKAVFDSSSFLLPGFLFDLIKTMKIYETLEVLYDSALNGSIDFLALDITREESIFSNLQGRIRFKVTLLNFQQSLNVFSPSIQDDSTRLERLLDYKAHANFFFRRGLLSRSVSVNRHIVDELIRQITLKEKHVEICVDLTKPGKLVDELAKVHGNLVLCMYKTGGFEYKEIETYIEHYFKIFGDGEKVLFIYYCILMKKTDYNRAKAMIEKLTKMKPQEEKYLKELELVNAEIEKSRANKAKLVKKMFDLEKIGYA